MEKEINRPEAGEPQSSQSGKSSVRILSSSPTHPSQRPNLALSDYSSPVKATKSISSFFTPPVIQNYGNFPLRNSPMKSSNLKESPEKASSLIHVKPVPSSVLVSPKKVEKAEDSGSDLILSEGDEEGESSESENEARFKATAAKQASFREIDKNISDFDEESEDEKMNSKRLKKSEASESEIEGEGESESSSDISVIISLPSTDSNEATAHKSVVNRFSDFSNSEYESLEEDEADVEEDEIRNIPIILDSDSESYEPAKPVEIPLMVFNQHIIESFPIEAPIEEKIVLTERKPMVTSVIPPAQIGSVPVIQAEMPEKVPERPTFESRSVRDKQLEALKASCKQSIAEIERKRGFPMTEQEIRRLLISSLPGNPPKSSRSAPLTGINQENRAELARKLLLQNTKSSTPTIQSAPLIRKPVPTPQISSLPTPGLAPRVTVVETVNNVPSVNLAPVHSSVGVVAPIQYRTGYVYDERMLHHFDPHDSEHPEKPARITSIYDKLRNAKLLDRARRIPIIFKPSDFATEVQTIHDVKYCRMINNSSTIRSVDELHQLSSQFNSVYFNPSTAMAATVAAAATIELCESIGRGEIENGFAIVRPPGHHAEHDEAMGFCIYNNVAVAASSLLRKKLAKKIMILDWDVHHGNGTQNAFVDSGDVLYVSLHRYDGGKFYPHIEEANHSFVGSGAGLGKSVNIAWNGPGFGDADYLFAFSRLIMPIAREFNPDMVIISAGFDAALGDPIGECELTNFGYSMMTQELMTLAGGRVALVLEGGYNLEVISKSYEACVKMLLKEAPPRTENPMIASPRAIFAIENTVNSHAPYWKCLFPKPAQLSISENTPQFPLTCILDHFWREECKKHFNLNLIPGLLKGCSDSLVQKYSNRILASDGALFNPEVLIIFAHESGPVYTNSFVSSLCLQASKIIQSQPFLPLLQAFHGQPNYNVIDINLPTRTWKLKQTSLGNEAEGQELNVIFSLLWDRLISRSGCKNVFFVAAGTPIYAIGNLINTNDVENQIRGCYFFSSSLFIPIINSSPRRSDWYRCNSQVIVPSQEPIKKVIGNAPPAFGSCFSSGQWLMGDSAGAVGDFKMEILNFIRTRLQRN